MNTSLKKVPRPAWIVGAWVGGSGVVAAGLYVAAWFSAVAVLKTQAEAWMARQQRLGYVIDHAGPTTSGFPARSIVTYADWRMTAPATSTAWSWRTAAVRVSAAPWSPLRFTVDLAGEHDLMGLGPQPTTISAVVAAVQPELTANGRIAEIAVNLEHVAVHSALSELSTRSDKAVAAIESAALSVVHDQTSDDDVWRVHAEASNWHAPLLEDPSAFGPHVRKLRFDADLKGALPSGTLPEALQAWHESGGTLDVRELLFDWPPLSVSATGTLALDGQLQPVGALTATFTGFNETLDAFAHQSTITRSEADAAQAVLNLIARKPENGGAPELHIAVTAQDGKLYLGPIPLTTLERVTWPTEIQIP